MRGFWYRACEQNLPGQYVVEPKPGAAGLLAGDYVAHAAPDGYTLLFGSTTLLLTLPMMNKKANYSSKDFVPIAGFATSPFVVYTANKPDKPKTLQELLDRVKKDGGTFGSNGHGSFPHLVTLLMLQKAGATRRLHVPYKASPQTLTDLAAGELLFVVDNPASAAPFMQNNSLRALAVTSAKRLDTMPDVPTVAEVLGTDFDVTVWGALFAPKGTPEPIVSALEAAVQKSLTDPELKDRLRTMELIHSRSDRKTCRPISASRRRNGSASSSRPAWRSMTRSFRPTPFTLQSQRSRKDRARASR